MGKIDIIEYCCDCSHFDDGRLPYCLHDSHRGGHKIIDLIDPSDGVQPWCPLDDAPPTSVIKPTATSCGCKIGADGNHELICKNHHNQ